MNITTGWVIKRQHDCKLAEQPVFWCICRLAAEESWASISKNYSPRIFASEEEAAEQCKEFTECEIVPLVVALEGGKRIDQEPLCNAWLHKYAIELAGSSEAKQERIISHLRAYAMQRHHWCRFAIHLQNHHHLAISKKWSDMLIRAGVSSHTVEWIRYVIHTADYSQERAIRLCDLLEAEDKRQRLQVNIQQEKPGTLLPLTKIGDQPLRTVGELRQFIAELDDSMLLQSNIAPGRYSCPIIARAHKAKRPDKTDYRKHPNLYLTGYKPQHGDDPNLSKSWKEITDNPTA